MATCMYCDDTLEGASAKVCLHCFRDAALPCPKCHNARFLLREVAK